MARRLVPERGEQGRVVGRAVAAPLALAAAAAHGDGAIERQVAHDGGHRDAGVVAPSPGARGPVSGAYTRSNIGST